MLKTVRGRVCLTLLALIASVPASAQTVFGTAMPHGVGTLDDRYRRLLQLTGAAPLGSRMIRPLAREGGTADSIRAGDAWKNPWKERFAAARAPVGPDSAGQQRFAAARGPVGPDSAGQPRFSASADASAPVARLDLVAPTVRGTYNSAVPFGMNDGAMWAGRGASGAIDVGAQLRWRGLTARLAPTVTWSQNRDFTLAPLVDAPVNASPFADQWLSGYIDRPQRFGTSSVSRIDGGESVVRYDWRALAVGAGTESLWLGPGMDNAILMTNNAGGIPHAFVGTGQPVDVWVGRLEAMYLAGRLHDSDYWRTGDQPNRNRRWLSALTLVLEPRGAPGLYVGAGRLFYESIPPGGLGAGDFFDVLQPFQKKALATPDNPSGNDLKDQMLALWGRWVFPEVGFEVWVEWGRNDHSWDVRDFVVEPDHATARVLGFQKVFQQQGGFMTVRAEATSLAQTRTAQVRDTPVWYAHHKVLQGYTQNGQVVGAGIGPGSDMQGAYVEWFRKWGSVGVDAERLRDDSDAFYRFYADTSLHRLLGYYVRHDVSTNVGLRGTAFVGPVDLTVRALRGTELNRYTVYRNDVGNWHGEVRATWRW